MQKQCAQCQAGFEIADADLVFYDQVSPKFNNAQYSLPAPSQCPTCRIRRRMAHRNERSLYRRGCDLCKKDMIALYPDTAPFPVYCNACWWNDSWDPNQYGKNYDFSVPFFEQFASVNNEVPHIAMMNDNGVNSENCEYTQDFAFGKDCYLVVGAWYLQDCYFCGRNCVHSKDLTDCFFIVQSEHCFECTSSQKLYNCRYVRSSENCTDCLFGFDLRGCTSCFGCCGLRHKKYHWFNEPLSESEYKERLSNVDSSSYSKVEAMKKKFEDSIEPLPRRPMNLQNAEGCTGDYLSNCENVHDSYIIFNAKDCRYCDMSDGIRSCFDTLHTGGAQFCYESITPDDSYMTLFSFWCWKDKYTYYSDNCHASQHLFGCTSVRRGNYQILNKQYTQEDYEELVPKIIEHMNTTGEWGEFFPMNRSPFSYNETMAQESFPMKKDEVALNGLQWKESLEVIPKNEKSINADSLPDRIEDIPDDILNWNIICESSGKSFKIIKQELDIYREQKIPIPHLHPDERHYARLKSQNTRGLHNRTCQKCQKAIQTTYSPDRPETVYCEECYLKEVY